MDKIKTEDMQIAIIRLYISVNAFDLVSSTGFMMYSRMERFFPMISICAVMPGKIVGLISLLLSFIDLLFIQTA